MQSCLDKQLHLTMSGKIEDMEHGLASRDDLVCSNEKIKEVSFFKTCKEEGKLTCAAYDAQYGSTTNQFDIVEVSHYTRTILVFDMSSNANLS